MRKRNTLTNRERQLIAFACQGMTSKEISETMTEWWNNASVTAIDQQYWRLYKKLGVPNRTSLVRKALELGIITYDGKSVFVNYEHKI
jgi:DNA-binding NarL/FixJ family response regulator